MPETAALPPDTVPRLELRGITKRFGDCPANDGIDLTLAAGEVHALLGENGAGKSTLVKIIYGVLHADAGSAHWHGEPVAVRSPAQARRLGIGMVFQHFSLFESLTVTENIALGLDCPGDLAALARRIADLAGRYGLALDPGRLVHELSAGERQRVEIVRCLVQQPRLLILDEPTSVLAPAEVSALFRTLRRLAAEGRTILIISHKLEEIRALCDRATVLREGRVVGTCMPRAVSAAALAELMIGRTPPRPEPGERPAGAAVRLAVHGLTTRSGDPFATDLDDASFAVRGGEILGIAGVAGNGQAALMAALSGEMHGFSPGAILIDGRPAGHLGPRRRRALGLAVVPEDRAGHGAVPGLSLAGNALLTGYDRRGLVAAGLIRFAAVRRFAAEIIGRFHVTGGGPDDAAAGLSGGNLQKFVVGREVLQAPGVLVAAAPTWGVDAGATAMIRQALLDLAQGGAAVVVVSPDLDELAEVADRILVISRGRLVETADIGLAMGGVFDPESGGAAPAPLPGSQALDPGPGPVALAGIVKGRRPLTLEPRSSPSLLWVILSPALAATLTVLTGAALFAAMGYPPLAALYAYFVQPLSSPRGLAELAVKATPLALCATGLALGFRANVWNIGAEGQLTVGAICGSAVALAGYGETGWWTLPLMLLAGVGGGMAWAALPALLRTRWHANEILTSLMLSYVALLLLDWLVHGPLRDPAGFAFPESRLFEPAALLPVLVPGTRLHLGALLALLAAGAAWLVLQRSLLGFEIKVFGLAPAAAGYAGFHRDRLVWTALLTSGGLAGLAGVIEVAGPIGQLTPAVSPGYGFTAIIVAFLGRLHPLGVVGAALVMALTYLGAESAQIALGLPRAVTGVFQGQLLFTLLATDLLVRYRVRWHRAAGGS